MNIAFAAYPLSIMRICIPSCFVVTGCQGMGTGKVGKPVI
jgi:hypothetical protein